MTSLLAAVLLCCLASACVARRRAVLTFVYGMYGCLHAWMYGCIYHRYANVKVWTCTYIHVPMSICVFVDLGVGVYLCVCRKKSESE